MGRFAQFSPGGGHAIRPRLDPIGPQRRLDPYPSRPIVGGYLEGRPVIFAQPDPRTRRPGMPSDLTVALTTGRFRRAIDIERGRATGPYEPTPIDYFPPIGYEYLSGMGHAPATGQRHKWLYVVGGAGIGALLSHNPGVGAAVGGAATWLAITGIERYVKTHAA